MYIYTFFSFLLSLFSILLQTLKGSLHVHPQLMRVASLYSKIAISIIRYILICSTWCSAAEIRCFINNISFQRQIVKYRVIPSLEQPTELFKKKKNDKGNEVSNITFTMSYKYFKFNTPETVNFTFWIYIFSIYCFKYSFKLSHLAVAEAKSTAANPEVHR